MNKETMKAEASLSAAMINAIPGLVKLGEIWENDEAASKAIESVLNLVGAEIDRAKHGVGGNVDSYAKLAAMDYGFDLMLRYVEEPKAIAAIKATRLMALSLADGEATGEFPTIMPLC